MRWRTLGKWILAVGLFALVFYLGDVRELLHLQVVWVYALGMFLATFAFILLHTLRWKKIVDALSKRQGTSFLPFYKWMIHSYTLGYIMPKDVSLVSVRTYYLKQHENLPLSASLFSVALDRLLDLVVFLVVVIPSLLFVTRILSPAISFIVMALSVGALLLILRWKGEETFHILIRFYRKILTLPVIRNRMRGGESEIQGEYSLGQNGFYTVLTWSVGTYLLLVLRFFFTGLALGVDLSLLQSLFVIPVIQISGLVNITPGSLGILELGSWGALLLIGAPKDQILRFVIGQRVLLTAVLLLLILINHLFFFLRGRWQWMGQKG
jgi:uncharacterized protein (TIRG00374 family)